jgi:hypothetical protein
LISSIYRDQVEEGGCRHHGLNYYIQEALVVSIDKASNFLWCLI